MNSASVERSVIGCVVGFLKLWSVIFVVVTTLVMLFKHEAEVSTRDAEDVMEDALTQSVTEAYKQLWQIVHLPAVLSLIAALMTMKVNFSHIYQVFILLVFYFLILWLSALTKLTVLVFNPLNAHCCHMGASGKQSCAGLG